ncbi:hypothetical protein GIB67_013882 [Kingdonia uniflora]|uniref:Uncharacterized protein n=1 Tax=Kingdonia uniflora TaxID=39325 RepID=A0A7J7LDG5_9MAGN|nr:hypothetical protein GIB67_013882 [Kingdonia uniflora]
MTHRPRTDLFSSFNQLIALANLKELMDHQPWEDVHSMRLQAEAAQLAKIQCLQYLLQQTTASMTTNPNMDVLNLIKDNSILTSSQQLDIPTSYSLGDLNDSIMFPHLPNLQNPYSFQTSMNGELCQGYNNSTVIHQEGITPQSPWGSLSPSPVTDNNLAEACSSSCYEGGASSFWPELLLDDPGFMNEMA